MKKSFFVSLLLLLSGSLAFAQLKDPVVDRIVREGRQHSQLESLAYELLGVIGPRLTGSPQMQQAHHWVVSKYKSWGIEARNEKWGEWMAGKEAQARPTWIPGTGPAGPPTIAPAPS